MVLTVMRVVSVFRFRDTGAAGVYTSFVSKYVLVFPLTIFDSILGIPYLEVYQPFFRKMFSSGSDEDNGRDDDNGGEDNDSGGGNDNNGGGGGNDDSSGGSDNGGGGSGDDNGESLARASVDEIVGKCLGFRVEQRREISVSEWYDDYLSDDQVAYATVDAYCAFLIGRNIRAWQLN
ncbi:DNA repair endonuclease [Spatholobus suberectus]|nr:DNA repair endonuclease [Spatholobus suberectus]